MGIWYQQRMYPSEGMMQPWLDTAFQYQSETDKILGRSVIRYFRIYKLQLIFYLYTSQPNGSVITEGTYFDLFEMRFLMRNCIYTAMSK